jgi:long-subunit acyl-CoA synthetase (AMP-forming)/alkylation response protein AidB-like acyl-CoA dehydrogenase
MSTAAISSFAIHPGAQTVGDRPVAATIPAAASMVALMLTRLDASFDRPAVCDALDGGRTWTWGELIAASAELADHFDMMGLRRGDRLAHQGPHSPDWIVVDLACQLLGLVHVPLHADAAAGEHAAQLAWLAPRGIAWSGPGRGAVHAAGIPISIDLRTAPRSKHRGVSNGVSQVGVADAGVLTSAGWQRRHADHRTLRDDVARHAESCDPDACSTILLSSGTTGRPKGVMHSQRTVVANAIAASEVFLDEPDDVRLSWLPMSHSLARTGDLITALVRGGCLNIVTDRRRVLDACRVLPPTVVLGVPAFFERLERAAESGRIPDLSAALGGRVRVCVSGGAPVRKRTVAAFSARGLPLVQGYGLAEAGPVVTLSNPRIARPGTVGPAINGVELKLDTRPATRGQLLVRTPSRAIGVIDADTDEQHVQPEWLETGDLATIDADGHVRITGRIVDTLVLSGGTKVPPAEVEAALAEDALVAQVCVVGDGLAAPVALVVPDPAMLRAAIRRMGLRVWSRRAALQHPKVLQWLGRRLARRQRHLPRSWRVRRAVLVGRPFDAAHGEATESLKLKRTVIASHFAPQLAAAADPQAPPWMAVVSPGPPCGPQHADTNLLSGGRKMTTRTSWAAASLWGGAPADAAAPSGFSLAAEAAGEPLRDAVAAVVTRAARAIAELRDQRRLYDAAGGPAHPAGGSDWNRAPLADAPDRPYGTFSRSAEEAIGEAGLWGLLVPEQFGGAGCSMQELARVITRFAADVPTAAGMLSVHSSIGAVAALSAFGTPNQQERHLPGLAQGRPLSIFGATEPDAGCDLHAIRSRLDRHQGRLLLSGTKMFITGATHGRLVKLLALLDGRPAVVLVRLPDTDTPSFRLRHYRLHPLKHAHNAALEFTQHEVNEEDILQPPEKARDAMPIIWHGLNRGRVTLAAQAGGTLRLLLRQARDHALSRQTWGEPIASRELIQGRLARIAAGIVACDSLAAWAAAAIDAGQSGELEAIIAKIVAGECVREGAINSLGVHGGRAFLVGHPLGDSFHDHFAVTVYEGESDLLGLALFKGLAKHHPLAGLAREASAGRRAAAWLAWRIGLFGRRPHHEDRGILDRRLRDHAAAARRLLDAAAVRIDRGIRRQGKALADRQLLVGSWSAEVRDLVSVLAVAHHADATGDDGDLLAADCWCRLAIARARGRRLTAADHAALAALGRQVVEGGSL